MSETTPDLRELLKTAVAYFEEIVDESADDEYTRFWRLWLREAAAALAVPRQPEIDEKDLCLPVGHGLKGENVHSEPGAPIPVEATATGTYNCPICGFDKPHTHDQRTVEWHRTGACPGFQDGPLNDNQRRNLRLIAENQHRITEEYRQFQANPRAFLQSGMTLCQQGAWVGQLLTKLEAAQAPHGQDATPQRTEGGGITND